MNIKKYFVLASIFCIFPFFRQNALEARANAALMNSFSSINDNGMVSLVENSNINVTHEDLLFKTYEENDEKPFVEATYQLNSNNKTSILSFGFPFLIQGYLEDFVGTNNEENINGIKVTVNGANINPILLIGDYIGGTNSIKAMTMDEIVNSINRSNTIIPRDKIFHRYDVTSTFSSMVTRATRITKSTISPIIGSEIEASAIPSILYCNFVQNGTTSFFIEDSDDVVEEFGSNISESELSISETLVSFDDVINYWSEIKQIPFGYAYGILTKGLTENQLFYNVANYNYYDAVTLIIYECQINGDNANNIMKVKYDIKNVTSVTDYVYISNPAKLFSSFNDLDITVLTKEASIIFNNVSFTNNEIGVYQAHLNALPESNIMFSVISNRYQTSQIIFLSSFVFFGVLVIGGIISFAMYSTKKQKKYPTN